MHLRLLIPAFHPWAKPRLGPVVGFLVLTVITSNVLMNGWPIGYPWRELKVARIPGRTSADLSELAWNNAQPLDVQLINGNGMDAGRSLLTLRALHDGNELFLLAERGEAGMWYGPRLEEHAVTRAGDFVYIPAGMPHLPYNRSENDVCTAVIARTDPNEQESVVLLPELDKLHAAS